MTDASVTSEALRTDDDGDLLDNGLVAVNVYETRSESPSNVVAIESAIADMSNENLADLAINELNGLIRYYKMILIYVQLL